MPQFLIKYFFLIAEIVRHPNFCLAPHGVFMSHYNPYSKCQFDTLADFEYILTTELLAKEMKYNK